MLDKDVTETHTDDWLEQNTAHYQAVYSPGQSCGNNIRLKGKLNISVNVLICFISKGK